MWYSYISEDCCADSGSTYRQKQVDPFCSLTTMELILAVFILEDANYLISNGGEEWK